MVLSPLVTQLPTVQAISTKQSNKVVIEDYPSLGRIMAPAAGDDWGQETGLQGRLSSCVLIRGWPFLLNIIRPVD